MIDFISSWAKGVIVAVIVGTIIEMILPEGNNKKYIKTVIGIYILFTIAVPIINKFTKSPISLDVSKYEKYLDVSYEIENIEEKVNSNIESVYKQNLEDEIKETIKQKNYEVLKIELDLEFENENNYGIINKISLNIKKNENQNSAVKKVESISIGDSKQTQEELEETISSSERTELKKYLSQQYEINEDNIIIF